MAPLPDTGGGRATSRVLQPERLKNVFPGLEILTVPRNPNLGESLKDFLEPQNTFGLLRAENMAPGALRSSPDVKKHAGHAGEAPGARFGRFGAFPGQIRPCTKNTKFSTGYAGALLLMVKAGPLLRTLVVVKN